MNTELTIIPNGNNIKEVETSITSFNQQLSDYLQHIGLPINDILVPVEERRKVIFSLEQVLEALPYEKKSKSAYLSKFAISVVSGLFDGALNFLWDETVRALRRLAISFDLQYFFSVAQTISNKYKSLSKEDDLESISEFDLLEITKRIGLISEVAYKQLENINYMRNHASAAHPNDNELTGFKMVSFAEDCIKYAINATPDIPAIRIKELSNNIRKNIIPDDDIAIISQDLLRHPQQRLNDFVLSLFGLYCDERQEEMVFNNIEKIIPHIGNSISEDTMYQIGSKYGVYRKNADTFKKAKTQRFLELIDGLKYKDEDSLNAELLEKLQDLRTAHFGWNNFYNESAYAQSIKKSMPINGIPNMVKTQFVKIICQCYVGNGLGYRDGIDEDAEPIYKEFIDRFGLDEIRDFILLFDDSEFTVDFYKSKSDKRLRNLCDYLISKVDNIHYKNILEYIKNYPHTTWDKMSSMSEYKNLINKIK